MIPILGGVDLNELFLTRIIENGGYSIDAQRELKKCINQVMEALQVVSDKISPVQNKEKEINILGDINFLGDIHGNLPGAIKALHHMGVIDNEGNWSNSGKTLVQTGDIIDRKEYSLATILYFKALKEQISENKQNGNKDTGSLIQLIGNHEQYNVRYEDSCSSEAPAYDLNAAKAIREVLELESKKGNYDLMYANNEKNVIATHGEFSKHLLRELVHEVSKENGVNFSQSKKLGGISKNEIYKFLDEIGLTKEDIAEHLNNLLHEEGINGPTVFSIYQQVEYSGPKGTVDRNNLSKEAFKDGLGKGCKKVAQGIGMGWRKTKANKAVAGGFSDLTTRGITSEEKPNLPVAITAHTVMFDTLNKVKNLEPQKKEELSYHFASGKISNIHSNIYIDTNISSNRIAYLNINKENEVVAFESSDQGHSFDARNMGNTLSAKDKKFDKHVDIG